MKYSLIREFSIFESAPSHYKKAVFVISSPVAGPVEETLKAIISASSFHYCIVVTTCHPAVTRCHSLLIERLELMRILQLHQSPNERLELGGPKLNPKVSSRERLCNLQPFIEIQNYLSVFSSLEENLLHWMGNVNMTAEVLN